ncbi:MAG: ABC transporter permease [Candidatus Hodarchaeales archaeon]
MRFAFLIALRLWRQLSRDPRTLALAIFAPILFVVMFGIAFGGEIENVPIVVINEDSDADIVISFFGVPIINKSVSAIGDSIVGNLQQSSKVKLTLGTNFTQAKAEVLNKKYIAAILIPKNFTYNLASPFGENVTIELFLDNSDPQVGAVVLQAFQQSFQDATGEFKSNLGLDISYAYGEELSTLDFFSPGLIGFGVFFFSFILVIMNLIAERKNGTLALLLQCPYDKGQIVIGYLLAFSLVSMIQTTVIIVFSSLFFNVSFGSTIFQYISLYIAAVVLGWTGLVLAIFLSSFARSEFQAVQFIPMIILPAILVSGILIPIESIPETIRWVSYILPTTYGVHLLRAISIEGLTLTIFNVDLLAQILFFLVFLFGSRFTLKES